MVNRFGNNSGSVEANLEQKKILAQKLIDNYKDIEIVKQIQFEFRKLDPLSLLDIKHAHTVLGLEYITPEKNNKSKNKKDKLKQTSIDITIIAIVDYLIEKYHLGRSEIVNDFMLHGVLGSTKLQKLISNDDALKNLFNQIEKPKW